MATTVRSFIFLDRYRLIAILCLIAFLNGTIGRIADGFRHQDLTVFISNTLDISVIVWLSLAVGIWLVLRSPRIEPTSSDFPVVVLASVAIAIPVAPLSWLALTLLSWNIVRTSPVGSNAHRGGWILLAVTIPMFWSRALFSLFSGAILNFDAMLVGWIVGTERIGNAIEFADGSGQLWIAPSCSSFANVSLAVLCFALFLETHECRRKSHYFGWAILAAATVLAINVIRLSFIGLYSENFDLIHGAIGTTVANWLTVAAIFGIFAFGMRNDRLAI